MALIPISNTHPFRIFSATQKVLVHLQVKGQITVRIACTANELYQPPPTGPNIQGLEIQATDGIKSLWWIGDFWAIGNNPGFMDVQVLKVL